MSLSRNITARTWLRLFIQTFYPLSPLLVCRSTSLMSLHRVIAHRLYPSHHLLLRNQMIDSLQQAQKTLHAPAPFIQHFIRVSSLCKRDDSRRPVDLGVDSLSRHKLTDVAFRLFLVQIE